MGRASIAYTNKDYESLRRELLARVPQLTDRWTDFNASDLGVVLLELFCGIGDMLAYYLDAQAPRPSCPPPASGRTSSTSASSSATGLTARWPPPPLCDFPWPRRSTRTW
jgi:hypothetical protein